MSERAEERLEAEMRRVLIDFFERFFLWCALFRPVRGSRGMRGETELTRFGKVRVLRRFVPGNRERPGFLGRFGRRTRACEDAVAEEGCDRSSFRRAETVSRAEGNFPKQIFTVDCCHALGYVSKVCEYLAGDAKEAKAVYGKARARLLEHDFGRAEKYLKGKYKARFAEDGMRQWSEEAAKAWKYLDARRRHMDYGWLRRHGYLIGSGHIESACKVIVGQRCTRARGCTGDTRTLFT